MAQDFNGRYEDAGGSVASRRMRILTVVGYYLPGYKAGGPIRSIASLVDRLGDEFEFHVVTADRDLGDSTPYPQAEGSAWQSVGKASVLYLRPRATLRTWHRLLNSTRYDILYLNSFFSPATRAVLLLRRVGLAPDRPMVLAPCGEFSQSALKLKGLKKRVYTALAKRAGLCNGIIWKASNQYEEHDILAVIGSREDKGRSAPIVRVAPDLPPRYLETSPGLRPEKKAGAGRIVFLSRVSPMKNLDFALDLLAGCRGEVEFDIHGPLEDVEYWKGCQARIERLPANIRVNYKGEVPPDKVGEIFSRYHLFLLPTRGENYGHAILESLRAGCPVLSSDRTMWRDLRENSAGWDLPLEEPEQFNAALRELLAMDGETFRRWSLSAEEYGRKQAEATAAVEASRRLFLESGRQ